MGARGPTRKPKRPQAQIAPGVPPPPDWLDPAGKTEYKRVVKLLLEANADLRHVDMACVATYAQGYSDIARLTKDLRKEGETLTTEKGGYATNPKINALASAHRRCSQSSARLGFTPMDRLRLPMEREVSAGEDEDSLSSFDMT